MDEDFFSLVAGTFRTEALSETSHQSPNLNKVVNSGINTSIEYIVNDYKDAFGEGVNSSERLNKTRRFILGLIVLKAASIVPNSVEDSLKYFRYVKAFTSNYADFTNSALSEYSRFLIKEISKIHESDLILIWARELKHYSDKEALSHVFQMLINFLTGYALKCSDYLFQEFNKLRFEDMVNCIIYIYEIDRRRDHEINLCALLALRIIIDFYDLEGINKVINKPFRDNNSEACNYFERLKLVSPVLNDQNKNLVRKIQDIFSNLKVSPNTDIIDNEVFQFDRIKYFSQKIHNKILGDDVNVIIRRALYFEKKIIVKQYNNVFKLEGLNASIMTEIEILKCLSRVRKDRKMFLKYYDSAEIEGNVTIVMKDGGINLKKYLEKLRNSNSSINQDTLNRWVSDLISTFQWLTSKGIIHCDINPQNILYYEKRDSLKIIDFSASYMIKQENYCLQDISHRSIRGSPKYIAPELFTAKKNETENFKYDPKISDVFSLGLTLLECFILRVEIINLNNPESNEKLMKEIDNSIGNERIKTLLKGMLRAKPDERFTFEKCQNYLNQDSEIYSYNTHAIK